MAHIAEKTGWTQDEIMRKPFLQLILMMADSPRLRKKGKQKITTDEELESFFGTKID